MPSPIVIFAPLTTKSRGSSVAEQGTHKPLVESSNLSLGTQNPPGWRVFLFSQSRPLFKQWSTLGSRMTSMDHQSTSRNADHSWHRPVAPVASCVSRAYTPIVNTCRHRRCERCLTHSDRVCGAGKI